MGSLCEVADIAFHHEKFMLMGYKECVNRMINDSHYS
jgi:hypothetical protein